MYTVSNTLHEKNPHNIEMYIHYVFDWDPLGKEKTSDSQHNYKTKLNAVYDGLFWLLFELVQKVTQKKKDPSTSCYRIFYRKIPTHFAQNDV